MQQRDSLHARDGGRRDKFCMDGARFDGDDRSVTERIANLKKAVETMHRCKAVHVDSEPVIELFQGQIAWDGVVETFDLMGHPKAKRCYAWSYRENSEPQYTTVLEIHPVDSAETAVKVAIAAKVRERKG